MAGNVSDTFHGVGSGIASIADQFADAAQSQREQKASAILNPVVNTVTDMGDQISQTVHDQVSVDTVKDGIVDAAKGLTDSASSAFAKTTKLAKDFVSSSDHLAWGLDSDPTTRLEAGGTFDKSDLIREVIGVNNESETFRNKNLVEKATDVLQDVDELSEKLGLEEGDTISTEDMRTLENWEKIESANNSWMDKFAEARTDSDKSIGIPIARPTTLDAPSLTEQLTEQNDGMNPALLC